MLTWALADIVKIVEAKATIKKFFISIIYANVRKLKVDTYIKE